MLICTARVCAAMLISSAVKVASTHYHEERSAVVAQLVTPKSCLLKAYPRLFRLCVDDKVVNAGGYEPLSLTDVSGVFLIVLGAYVLATVALILEHAYSKWSAAQGHERARDATARSWSASDLGEYQLMVLHRGAICPLSLWLRSRISDAMYRDMMMGLSLAATSRRTATDVHVSSTAFLY